MSVSSACYIRAQCVYWCPERSEEGHGVSWNCSHGWLLRDVLESQMRLRFLTLNGFGIVKDYGDFRGLN